MKTAA